MAATSFSGRIYNGNSSAPVLTYWHGTRLISQWSGNELRRRIVDTEKFLENTLPAETCAVYCLCNNNPYVLTLLFACLNLNLKLHLLSPLFVNPHNIATLGSINPDLVIIDHNVPGATVSALQQQGKLVYRIRHEHIEPFRKVLQLKAKSEQIVNSNGPVKNTGMAISQPEAVKNADWVLQLQSSGSNGKPKILRYSREQLDTFLAWQALLFCQFKDRPISSAKKPGNNNPKKSPFINILPLSHLGGLSFCLQALDAGRPLHLLDEYEVDDYFRLALNFRVQLVLMVPSMFELLLNSHQQYHNAFRPAYCLSLGEAISTNIIQKIEKTFHTRVFSTYGLSECLSGIGHEYRDKKITTPPGSCGKLLFGETKLEQIESCSLTSLYDNRPVKQTGVLWVKNPTVFNCYADQNLNRKRLQGGWFNTGDRFYCDEQGYYYYLGRADDMLVCNGRNIYPEEIEQVFIQHAFIKHVVLVPLTTVHKQSRLGLLVVLDESASGKSLSAAQMLDFYLEHGNKQAVPVWVCFCDHLPLLGPGKTDRTSAAHLVQADYDKNADRMVG